MDYKGYLEGEVVSGIKSKLWEELTDFSLDQLEVDPYLSSLQ